MLYPISSILLTSISLLINDKLNLGLQIGEVSLGQTNSNLNLINKGNLLDEVKRINDKDCWLWLLNELRNHSIHRKMLNIE